MKIAVLGYNFPHWKTQQVLVKMICWGYRPALMVAAPYVEKPVPTPDALKRIKPNHVGLVHPRTLARVLDIPCVVVPHADAGKVLKERRIDIGVIAGAPILKRDVIDSCRIGIINIHPGKLPEMRGLDTIRWSVYHDIPLGNTAHWIDERIDAGSLILWREARIEPHDTWLSLRLRVDEEQIEMLPDVMDRAVNGRDFQAFGEDLPATFKYMSERGAQELDLEDYIRRHSCSNR